VRADGPFAAPAFPLVAIFVGVVVTPITLYLHLAHPAWSWMYMVDPAEIPALAIVPVLVGHGGMVVAGWYLGAYLLRTDKDRPARGALAGGALVALVATLIAWPRIGTYGTYGDYHAGVAHDLWDVKLGYVLIGLVVGIGAAAGYVGLELVRDSRRVRTR
jgi:hypothetical protein